MGGLISGNGVSGELHDSLDGRRSWPDAARGEFEPVQVVLRTERDGRLLGAEVTPLHKRWSDARPITVRIDEVAYVQVTHPTDKTCQPGWYPDPLPPLRGPLAL